MGFCSMSASFDFQIQRWFSSCSLEVKGKYLLLKTQCASDQLLNMFSHWWNTRPRGSWAGPNMDAFVLRTGFHGTRRWHASVKGGKQSIDDWHQLVCLLYFLLESVFFSGKGLLKHYTVYADSGSCIHLVYARLSDIYYLSLWYWHSAKNHLMTQPIIWECIPSLKRYVTTTNQVLV